MSLWKLLSDMMNDLATEENVSVETDDYLTYYIYVTIRTAKLAVGYVKKQYISHREAVQYDVTNYSGIISTKSCKLSKNQVDIYELHRLLLSAIQLTQINYYSSLHL